jgi:hypothetical protein
VNIFNVIYTIFVKHDINIMLSETVHEVHILIVLLFRSGVQRDLNCTVDNKALYLLAMKNQNISYDSIELTTPKILNSIMEYSKLRT